MKLVAGLGNPGKRYAESRHNMGYLVVEELARRWAVEADRYDRHFEALVGQARRAGDDVLLLRPQTYMNASGRSVAGAWRYYKLSLPDLMVVFDDLDLPVGRLRLRASGSAGGHRGLDDVIRHVGSDEFPRLRIGIGRVDPSATVEYVLGRFEASERPSVDAAIHSGADAIECWLSRGLDAAMNEFNRREPAEGSRPRPDAPAKGEQP